MRYEVKYIKGRFVAYGKHDVNKTPIDAAFDYINDERHAERYCVAAIQRGGKGRPGAVRVMVYERAAIRAAVERFAANPSNVPALAIHNGAVAVMRCEYAAIRRTFGTPLEELSTTLTRREDLKPDASCANAPYARAWEKVCAAAAGGKWCGALRNVQIDFTVNEADD